MQEIVCDFAVRISELDGLRLESGKCLELVSISRRFSLWKGASKNESGKTRSLERRREMEGGRDRMSGYRVTR